MQGDDTEEGTRVPEVNTPCEQAGWGGGVVTAGLKTRSGPSDAVSWLVAAARVRTILLHQS